VHELVRKIPDMTKEEARKTLELLKTPKFAPSLQACEFRQDAAAIFHRPICRMSTYREAYDGALKPPKRAVVSGVNPFFAIAAFTSGILFTITVTGPANSTICGSPSPKAGGNVQ
jgi:hypothetical protein